MVTPVITIALKQYCSENLHPTLFFGVHWGCVQSHKLSMALRKSIPSFPKKNPMTQLLLHGKIMSIVNLVLPSM